MKTGRVHLARFVVLTLVMTSVLTPTVATLRSEPAAAADYGWSFPWAFGAYKYGAYVGGVNLGTLSFTYSAEDFSYPGRKLPLSFVRWHNSAAFNEQWSSPAPASFGYGWTHSYNWFVTESGGIKIHRGDGAIDTFTSVGPYYTAPDTDAQLYWLAPEAYRWDLKYPDGTTYHFSRSAACAQSQYSSPFWGCLDRIDEPAGNHIDLAYGVNGLSSITDTVGRQLLFTYGFFCYTDQWCGTRITSIRENVSGGRSVTYAYETSDFFINLATVTDKLGNAVGASGHQWQYTYDIAYPPYAWADRLASATDPDGRRMFLNTYRAQPQNGQVVSQTDALGRTMNFTDYGTYTFFSDRRGFRTDYAFDSRKRITSVLPYCCGTPQTPTTYTYDSQGHRTQAVDPLGNTTNWTYDAAGNPLTRLDAAVGGVRPTTTYSYDSSNHLTQVTDPRGFVTTATYDSTTKNLLSVSRQVGGGVPDAVTSYAYADAANPGMPTQITSPRGYVTTLAYDGRGNLSRSTVDGTVTTLFGYDWFGRLANTTDPDGNFSSQVYDANDRVTSRTDALNATSTATYDGTGNLLSETDRRGNLTSYVYNALGWLAELHKRPDPANAGQQNIAYFDYDANGNLVRMRELNFTTIIDYQYDELNRRTMTTTYTGEPGVAHRNTDYYDAAGRIYAHVNDDGQVNYGHDALSRLTSISGPGLVTISYQYDLANNRTQMTDGTGTAAYAYDGLGRVTSIASPNGTLTYTYDPDGNVLSQRVQIAGTTVDRTISYSYDGKDRLTGVLEGGRLSQYYYQPSGVVSQIVYPNGLTAAFSYDRDLRLTSLINTFSGNTITSHAYTLDAEGNRTVISDWVWGDNDPGVPAVKNNTYDGLNRLSAIAGGASEGFTFDGASNITSRYGPSATYTYDTADRLTSDGTLILGWSASDHLTSRGSDSFGYDLLGRLTSSNVGGTASTFAYDGDGLLAARTSAGATTKYLWGPGAVAPLVARGTDVLVRGLGPLYIVKADNTTVTLARDGQKNVRSELNDLGVVQRSLRYAAYGTITASYGSATPTLLGYASQLYDATGLYYMRARWYDPVTSRFMTRDPLARNARRITAFGYANGNPFGASDPTGLAAEYFYAPDGQLWVMDSGSGVVGLAGSGCILTGCDGGKIGGPRGGPGGSSPRLPRDVNVNPEAPDPLPTTRNASNSATQNARMQSDIQRWKDEGATDFRVNQQQVDVGGTRVGINRPDLQFTLGGRRYYVEYETDSMGAALAHGGRILANDTAGVFIPMWVP
jgi:RHS repeat-associated protein